MEKPFQLGITVGRFQAFHNGHRDMLQKALMLCETVGVFIGSSQESGTEKNPFTYQTRKELLEKVFGERLPVYPLPDIGVGNNAKWGEYVLDNVNRYFNKDPDLIISGKEDRRLAWFDGARGVGIAELYIPKTIDISASQMREMLLQGDFDTYKRYTDEALWDCFAKLQSEVLKAENRKNTASI